MAPQFICAACRRKGHRPEAGEQADDFLVACAICGAVDEKATYKRNAVDVSDRFGALMDDWQRDAAHFVSVDELRHRQFIDDMLEMYLVDPASRVVERSAGHFKAAVRSYYDRVRTEDTRRLNKKPQAVVGRNWKTKHLLLVSIIFTIQDSNMIIANSRLADFKAPAVLPHTKVRGDGSIMTPSLAAVFSRVHSLGPDHPAYIPNFSALRIVHKRLCKELRRSYSPYDLVMAQVVVMSERLQRLAALPWQERIEALRFPSIKPRSDSTTPIETAGPDDLTLNREAWNYMASVPWDTALEHACNLYRAQQVVLLWGQRHTVDVACATLLWAIAAAKQAPVPAIVAWTRELTTPYGGNENASMRRRVELRDMLVGWSTSFRDAGLDVPLVEAPTKGGVGDGIRGWRSDHRRPIPESKMAVAAAPVVARHWRLIMNTRLRTRARALPLDTEFTLAARMFAAAHHERAPRRRPSKYNSAASSRSQLSSRASSVQPSSRKPSLSPTPSTGSASMSASPSSHAPVPPPPPAAPASKAKSRDDMYRLMGIPVPGATPQQLSIEEMLAIIEDSSDEDTGDEPEQRHEISIGPRAGEVTTPVAFAFSIGPDGFSVAKNSTLRPAPHKRRSDSSPSLFRPSKRSRATSQSDAAAAGASPAPSSSASLRALSMSPKPPPSPTLATGAPSPAFSLASGPRIDNDASTVGLLMREREQYIAYNPSLERHRGSANSREVEAAMLEWVAARKADGEIPAEITSAYLSKFGIRGDPRMADLGRIFRACRGRWSPAECLLRLGLKPIEFPPHCVVHSLIDLHQQLGHYRVDDKLAPEGAVIDAEQLEKELDILFAHGDEKLADIINTAEEADVKEQLYLQTGTWAHPRGQLEPTELAAHRKLQQPEEEEVIVWDNPLLAHIKAPRSSRRINYHALRRLCNDEGWSEDEEEAALDNLAEDGSVPETLNALEDLAEDNADGSDGEGEKAWVDWS